MAWDPTQGQEQSGNGEQGQPANGGPEPNPDSSAPQTPYEGQRQPPPSGADPYSGYGTPPQNPYGTPQNPYTSPPSQNPYATPPQYTTPPYQQGGYGYGYAPPQPAPRSIGQAIQELPYQYYRVLTKPSVRTFAEEMGKADWAMVWIQLLIWIFVGTIIGLIRAAIGLAGSSFVTNNTFNPASIIALTISGSFLSFIVVPVSFFIVVGIQYLLAKAFRGEGNFLTQGYTYLLFEVPIAVISYLLGLIPIFGAIAGFALAIYGIVLNVFSIMAVHRLSGGKAAGVVLIPIAVLILLAFLCAFIIAAIFIAATRTTTP